MFQFPGFAFLTLCIQVKNTCFSCLLITEVNNRKLSGGLPHSEIDGSKPILGSSSLIAEYHVLHRLLLPRHPPNALLALDLIQKKTGSKAWLRLTPTSFCEAVGPAPVLADRDQSKVIHFPLPLLVREGQLSDTPFRAE